MIKHTVKLIVWKHDPNEFGYCPIYIQITVERKTRYISTGHYIDAKKWDEKNQRVKDGFQNASIINPEITQRKSNVIDYIVKQNVAKKNFTADSIKTHFTTGKDLNNIFNFIENFCAEVKHKKDDQTIQVYQNHQRKLATFNGSKVLHFEDITQDFLRKYEKHLRDLGARDNYVHAIWKTLKTFFNAARKKQIITYYPFDQYENPIYRDPKKDYLTLPELKQWEDFADTTTNSVHKQTAVYFLLGCYSGLRISDWLTFDIKEHVVGDKIKLRARKNKEWVTIPFSGPLARNIERMRLLPLTIEEPTLNEKLKIIAKELKINKKLTSHCGRKTFAVTMCADRGISSETCAELLGITVSVCVKSYYAVTDHKIIKEVTGAWFDL